MNWLVLIIAFCVAAAMGALFVSLLERSRATWSLRRRLWTAVSVLPGFLLLLTAIAVLWTLAAGGGNRDLASAVYVMVGSIFIVVTLLGGLAGAALAARKGGR